MLNVYHKKTNNFFVHSTIATIIIEGQRDTSRGRHNLDRIIAHLTT